MKAPIGDGAAVAREVFARAIDRTAPEPRVASCLLRDRDTLSIAGRHFDLRTIDRVVAIAFGKVAAPMARAVARVLEGFPLEGLLASRSADAPRGWQAFASGHPLPDAQSLAAGRAALALLRANDSERTLVLFLVSGGGSALLEAPVDPSWTLEELADAHRALIGCGAPIAEVNAVRRRLSAIKGGGLAAQAPRAAQVSLYVSDTNPGDVASIASGATWTSAFAPVDVGAVVRRHGLRDALPARLTASLLGDMVGPEHSLPARRLPARTFHHVLLDNGDLVAAAADAARELGHTVVRADDLGEVEVESLAGALLDRARAARDAQRGSRVCVVSGGEAICPVRGNGRGGRNQELVLRAALLLEPHPDARFAVLSCGSDGIDGNSPAAGAVCDADTLRRGRAAGRDPRADLERSDSHAFLAAAGATITTGPLAHNVRDLRVVVAG